VCNAEDSVGILIDTAGEIAIFNNQVNDYILLGRGRNVEDALRRLMTETIFEVC
jgi:hypothetical protein